MVEILSVQDAARVGKFVMYNKLCLPEGEKFGTFVQLSCLGGGKLAFFSDLFVYSHQ